MVTANDLIVADDHEVPMWREGDRKVTVRPLVQGDTANAWSYLDWMCSASSNAAASMAMAHLILLRQTRTDYVDMSQNLDDLLNATPKAELQRMLVSAMESPVRRNGLDLGRTRSQQRRRGDDQHR